MSEHRRHILVIGGGAAGMAAALAAARAGCRVSLFEKNEKLGKKLFITGKGRCNVTNACPVEELFDGVVEDGDDYRLIFGYTEDVSRFNYGFVHGSKTRIGNLIVGWNEDSETIVVVPTVPDLSGCGEPTWYRRDEILKAYRNKYPTDAFVIYPDRHGYIAINAYDWLEDEKLYVYVSQEAELAAFTDFFLGRFAKK